jgi:quinol-cytochrome oxidoreductase complex cytochrome b subunit
MGVDKKWWEMKGVWGGLIAVLAGIGGLFGYTIAPDDQEALTGILVGLAGSVGGIIAIIGRILKERRSTDNLK